MKKLIRVADVYPAFNEYMKEQITFSRLVEIINEAANVFWLGEVAEHKC